MRAMSASGSVRQGQAEPGTRAAATARSYLAMPHLEPGGDGVTRRRRAAPAHHQVVVVSVVPSLRRRRHLLRAAEHGHTARATPPHWMCSAADVSPAEKLKARGATIVPRQNFAGMRSLRFRLLGRRSRCPCCESARRITQSANFRHNSPLRSPRRASAQTGMAEKVKLISSDKESFDVPADVARCVWRQQAPSPCVACLTHPRVTAPLAA